jgi:hypothetical protein
MEIIGVDELMRYLKGRYDASEQKREWRALSGRNHVRGSTDTFVLTDDSVYQIMSKDVSKDKVLAVGTDILRNEYFGSKQDVLRTDLDSKLERLVERPEFRTSYRSLRDDQDAYFA